MKLRVGFNGILINCKEKPYTMNNGQSGMSYGLALECNDEVGNVKCSKAVYDGVKNGDYAKYSECSFYGTYDTDYKSLIVEQMQTRK